MALMVWALLMNFYSTFYAPRSRTKMLNSLKNESHWEGKRAWKKVDLEVHVFSAYYDHRDGKGLFGQVQVMAFQENSYSSSLYCFLVYNNTTLCLDKPADRTSVFEDHRYYRTTMYSCYLPSFQVPEAVGLTTDEHCSDQTNKQLLTKVVYEKWSPVKEFGVCVHSPLFNMNNHQFLAEYIEMSRILGAEWFTLYIYSASTLARKLLKNYEIEGIVEVEDNWADGLPEKVVHYKGQDLLVQDCLYRNIYKVKYLVNTDLDELIFSKKHPNWHKMMLELDSDSSFGCFLFRHIAVLHDAENESVALTLDQKREKCEPGDVISELKIPRFLSYTQSSVRVMLRREKMIVKPLHVRKIKVHNVKDGLYGKKRINRVNPDMAALYHYRESGLEGYRKGSVYFDQMQQFAPTLFKQLKKRLCNLKEETV